MSFRFNPTVEDAIARAAARYGMPVNSMRTLAQIESGGRANASNPNSSAGGLYQFIDSTAKQYGLKDKFDPYQSADAAARLMRDNYNGLSQVLGRAPTTGELYLAHQQGLGGAKRLLSNPNAPASSLVGMNAVKLNAGSPDMTASQFAAKWINKANKLDGAAAASPVAINPAAVESTIVAGTAPVAAAGLPTLNIGQATQAAQPTQVASSDPISGIFSLLMQQQQQPDPIPMAASVERPKDTRPLEERVASTSMTPNAYQRGRRKYFG